MYKPEPCKVCGTLVETMTWRGTGYCSTTCQKQGEGDSHRAGYGADEINAVVRETAARVNEVEGVADNPETYRLFRHGVLFALGYLQERLGL